MGRLRAHACEAGAVTAAGNAGLSSSPGPSSPVRSLGLWWVRRDMRLDDNEALTSAVRHADATLAVHILDPRDLLPRRPRSEGGLGVPKLGPPRAK